MTEFHLQEAAKQLLLMLEEDDCLEYLPQEEIEQLAPEIVEARLRELGFNPDPPEYLLSLCSQDFGVGADKLSALLQDEFEEIERDERNKSSDEVLAELNQLGVNHIASFARAEELLRQHAALGESNVTSALPTVEDRKAKSKFSGSFWVGGALGFAIAASAAFFMVFSGTGHVAQLVSERLASQINVDETVDEAIQGRIDFYLAAAQIYDLDGGKIDLNLAFGERSSDYLALDAGRIADHMPGRNRPSPTDESAIASRDSIISQAQRALSLNRVGMVIYTNRVENNNGTRASPMSATEQASHITSPTVPGLRFVSMISPPPAVEQASQTTSSVIPSPRRTTATPTSSSNAQTKGRVEENR